jgi:pilus assembly protein CpaE
MPSAPQIPDNSGAGPLSVALMGPNDQNRRAITEALSGCNIGHIRELASYPADLSDLSRTLGSECDIVVVDLDGDSEYALEVVQSVSAIGVAVIVFSAKANFDLALRCMRAGAREFLTLPLNSATLSEALARIATRSAANAPARKVARKLFVFMGAKGGCGVTTLASNFAVSLAQESGHSTLLIDLGMPLGDAALNLGMVAEYSTFNALENSARLDASFLQTLLAKHPSGLSVLAAPTEFTAGQPSLDALDRLLAVARQNFDYVVVDAGARMDLKDARFFDDSAILYLVTQVGLTELRNANRMITQYFGVRGPRLQVIVNRYGPHALPLDDKQIQKALTRAIDWKIPDDYATARRTQQLASPLAMEDSQISRVLRRMARTACGLPEDNGKEQTAGLLSWARRGLTKVKTTQPAANSRESSAGVGAAGILDPGHANS